MTSSKRVTPAYVIAVPWDEQRKERALELSKEAPATVVWDSERDALKTFATAFELAAPSPLGAVFMEDDVQLCEDWRPKIEAVIAQHGTTMIQFFSMRGADLTVGSRLEPGSSFMMTQCFYLPYGMIDALGRWLRVNHEYLRAYLRKYEADDKGAQDWAIKRFLTENGLRYWLSVPSLVQHEQWRSVIRSSRSTKRQAKIFADDV